MSWEGKKIQDKRYFDIWSSSTRVYLDSQLFTYESLLSLKRLAWNIIAWVYVILQNNELKRLSLSNRHKGKHKIVFLCLLRLEKIRTNRTYVDKSWYAKHNLGYYDWVYFKWQRHDHRNPTKRHWLKSLNDIPWTHTVCW